ncbi:unnamed protein product [Camellia sinensis]
MKKAQSFLRDDGAIRLAQTLKVVNEALTSLNLGFNEIRDKGAFAIAQALKANEDVRIASLNLGIAMITGKPNPYAFVAYKKIYAIATYVVFDYDFMNLSRFEVFDLDSNMC